MPSLHSVSLTLWPLHLQLFSHTTNHNFTHAHPPTLDPPTPHSTHSHMCAQAIMLSLTHTSHTTILAYYHIFPTGLSDDLWRSGGTHQERGHLQVRTWVFPLEWLCNCVRYQFMVELVSCSSIIPEVSFDITQGNRVAAYRCKWLFESLLSTSHIICLSQHFCLELWSWVSSASLVVREETASIATSHFQRD